MEAHMRSKLLHGGCGERSFAIILDSGDEAMQCCKSLPPENASGAQN